jgi:proteasome inhibitor subunit 1 (PI31)
MAQNILDPSAVLSRLPNLLPGGARSLASPQDAVVALFHAALANLGFRLVGTDESSSVQTYENNVLPDGWNAHGPGHYSLRYKHEQSSLEFLIKVSKLGTRTMVNAIALEVCSRTDHGVKQHPDFLPPERQSRLPGHPHE